MRFLFRTVVFLGIWGLGGVAWAHRPLALEPPTEGSLGWDVEWGTGPVIGDLTGAALSGRGHQGRFESMRGLRLDSVDAGVRVAKGLRLMGRLEVGADDDRQSREVVMGAFEMGLSIQPFASRIARTFVSAGAGWVGGGFMSPDAIALGEHVFDPQVHVQAGLDLRLAGGWSFELRLPFRYLWGSDLPLAAATVGFRHAM